MLELYLDYNVFIELEDIKGSNSDIYNKIIDKLKNFKIFYSYAHTEELAFAKVDDEKTKTRIETLKAISKNNCITFNFQKLQKDVRDTLNDSEFNIDPKFNLFLEETMNYIENERLIINENLKGQLNNSTSLKDLVLENYDNFKNFIINKQNLYSILNDKYYNFSVNFFRDCFLTPDPKNYNPNLCKKIIKNYLNKFDYMIALFEILFDFLYSINFYHDKSKNPYKSKIFDVTHAIFASQLDIFITCDQSFFKKVKIIYDFLGIQTKIYLIRAYNSKKSNLMSFNELIDTLSLKI